MAVAGFFVLFWLAGSGKIDMSLWTNPCGFKQRFGLPCPTCGMTTSTLAFAQGKLLASFYAQPAGVILCSLMVVLAILALGTAVFGVNLCFIKRFLTEVKVRYIILTVLALIVLGWAVSLARAMGV